MRPVEQRRNWSTNGVILGGDRNKRFIHIPNYARLVAFSGCHLVMNRMPDGTHPTDISFFASTVPRGVWNCNYIVMELDSQP